MALLQQQSVFTYATTSGGQTYYFDIVVDAQGLVSVRNIRSPLGPVDSMTNVPEWVVDDINEAMETVGQRVAETQVDSGTLIFTGQTYRDATIAPGVLNNTNYRVVYTTPDGVIVRTTNKTTTGFRAEVGFPYGSTIDPKDVGYVVLVSTQQASATGGTLTFTDADAGQKAVTFNPAFDTDAYRVILSPDDFFTARVINQSKTGFTVEIGHTLGVGQTADVGYDVFV